MFKRACQAALPSLSTPCSCLKVLASVKFYSQAGKKTVYVHKETASIILDRLYYNCVHVFSSHQENGMVPFLHCWLPLFHIHRRRLHFSRRYIHGRRICEWEDSVHAEYRKYIYDKNICRGPFFLYFADSSQHVSLQQ